MMTTEQLNKCSLQHSSNVKSFACTNSVLTIWETWRTWQGQRWSQTQLKSLLPLNERCQTTVTPFYCITLGLSSNHFLYIPRYMPPSFPCLLAVVITTASLLLSGGDCIAMTSGLSRHDCWRHNHSLTFLTNATASQKPLATTQTTQAPSYWYTKDTI